MRRAELRVGRVLGIGLSLHASWVLVFGLVVWVTTTAFGDIYPELSVTVRSAMGLATGGAFFACLLVHELAHAVTAQRFGIAVRQITLFLFGGVAEIEGEVPTPAREFAVALAGPAVSLFLASTFGLVAVRSEGVPALEGVTGTLAIVNLGVAMFNLIPGLPLDGGRLLRAWLWRRTGSFARATRVASATGVMVALGLVVFGLGVAMVGREPAGLWYVPMGVFLWWLARLAGHRVVPPAEPGGVALGDREGQAPQPRP